MKKVKQQQRRDLIEEFRSWAKEHDYLWQTQYPDKAICIKKWLFDNIQSIVTEHQYIALEKFVTYYGIERREMIALFDYCSNLDLSIIDWKTQEINDYASFIMMAFPYFGAIKLPLKSSIVSWGVNIIIDPIVATHMIYFIDDYMWKNYPHPTPSQLDMIVKTFISSVYASPHKIIKLYEDGYLSCSRSEIAEAPTMCLFAWISEYGKYSPIPYKILKFALDEALRFKEYHIIIDGISTKFLQTQLLVDYEYNDEALNSIWEILTEALMLYITEPYDLVENYPGCRNEDEDRIDYIKLYELIYTDLCQITKDRITNLNTMLDKIVTNKIRKEEVNPVLLAYYNTIKANKEFKRYHLEHNIVTFE